MLYEDEHLLALDKPGGLLTSPDRDVANQLSLMPLLHAGIAEGKTWAKERDLTYLANAHRLDLDTSGVLLLAKSKPVLAKLADFFGSEKPSAKYLALVHGAPAEDRFEIEAKLAPFYDPRGSGREPVPYADSGDPSRAALVATRSRVDSRHGKRAHTRFVVQERFDGWALVECEPLTARLHQIRVHLRHAGLPVAGDSLYGGRPLLLSRLKSGYRLKPNHTERPLIGQPTLHLVELSFPHPVTGQPVAVTAPLPKDLTVALKYLRRYGRRET